MVIVFCGPTIAAASVRHLLPTAEVRAPAMRGDVLRATACQPRAIGLIDGYFDRVPAVTHKEILWAMQQGVRVFGASSIGALRAAELARFGMEGVGEVYERVRSGEIADDDEVAVAHATAEHEYRAASDALVNIRATLRGAEEARVISREARIRLEGIAKATHYPDRNYAALVASAESVGIRSQEAAALKLWFQTKRRDPKQDDAKLMCRRIAEEEAAGWPPKPLNYVFVHTDSWEALRAHSLENTPLPGAFSGAGPTPTEVRAELILRGRLGAAYNAAVARALALELAQRERLVMDAKAVNAVSEEFRRERALLDADAFAAWARQQDLEGASLDEYFQRECLIRGVLARLSGSLQSHVLDYLRATGEYAATLEGAVKRRRTTGDSMPPAPAEQGESEAFASTLRGLLQETLPPDLPAYARLAGISLSELRIVLARVTSAEDGGSLPTASRGE